MGDGWIQPRIRMGFTYYAEIRPSSNFPDTIQPTSSIHPPNAPKMKPITRMPLRIPCAALTRPHGFSRPFASTVSRAANVAPVVGTGPPPEPPMPEQRNASERIERRRKHSELLKQAKDIRSGKDGRTISMKRRFWKHVSVQEVDGEFSACPISRQ